MRKFLIFAALLLPLSAGAQEFAARTSAGADVKLKKGLHLGVEEEIRIDDGLSGLDNLRTTLDLSWKVNKHLKFRGGYTLINPWKTSSDYTGFRSPRHRLFADGTYTWRTGDFQLSAKERLQLTHRTDEDLNVYQTTPNALALKSRIGVKYKGLDNWEPFMYLEARAALNDPWGEVSGSIQYTNSGKAYYAYTHTGYTHAYINRYRMNLGTDWSPAKHHSFTFNLLADYCSDYKIDTNGQDKWASKGVRLFADTTGWEDTFRVSLCLGYTYKF